MIGPHIRVPAWFDRTVLPEDRIPSNCEHDCYSAIRRMRSLGLTEQAWRLYYVHGDTVVDALGKPWIDDAKPTDSILNSVAFLNLIASCQMGRYMLPPRPLVASMRKWRIPNDRLDVIPYSFFRALWEACMAAEYRAPTKQGAIPHFIKTEMMPVVHWFFTTRDPYSGMLHWEELLNDGGSFTGHGWFGLKHLRYRGWLDREREQKNRAAKWDPLIESLELAGYCFVPLSNYEALREEGATMVHCIGTYVDRCAQEGLRAFSIRDPVTSACVATLTLRESSPGPGHWEIDELKGNRNAEVDEQVKDAALLFVLVVNDEINPLHAEISPEYFNFPPAIEPQPVDAYGA